MSVYDQAFADITPQGAAPAAANDPYTSAFQDLNAHIDEVKSQPAPTGFWKDMNNRTAGILDTALNIPAKIVGGVTYAGARAAGESPQEAAKGQADAEAPISNPIGRMMGATDTSGYNAQNPVTQAIGDVVGKGIKYVAQKTGADPRDIANIAQSASYAVPDAAAMAKPALSGAAEFLNGKGPIESAPVASGANTMGGVGSNAASYTDQATAAGANPQLVAMIKSQEDSGTLNPVAAQRNIQADSLPVPIQLLKGEATGDPVDISNEKNFRAANTALAYHLDQRPAQFLQNMDALKESVAPDVYSTNPTEMGNDLINMYQQKDQGLNDVINQKYQLLKDTANTLGIDAPIDGKLLNNNINADLSKEQLEPQELPAHINRALDKFNNGPMNFQDFITFRRNVSQAQREFAGTTTGYALGMVRDNLENLPLNPQAAALKPLLTDASNTAKSRFALMDNDPAYKAIVNGKASPDDFMRKYVIGGDKADIATMQNNLSENPIANQTIAAGTLGYLRSRAGSVNGSNVFNQAGFNKGIESIAPKMQNLLDSKTADTINNLGDVSRYTQQQSPGTFVNNSNTFTAALGTTASNAAEKGLNAALAFKGIPIPGGTWIKNTFQKRAQDAAVKEIMAPYPGLEK